MPRPLLGSLAGAALLAACSATPPPSPATFVTEAERSHYRATGRYEEVERLCHAFEGAYPGRARCATFGTTPEGRPMLAIVASADGTLFPAEARRRLAGHRGRGPLAPVGARVSYHPPVAPRRALPLALALAPLASCAGAPEPPPAAPPVVVIPVVTPSEAPSEAPAVVPAPTAKPAEPPPRTTPRNRVAITLRQGDPPCTLEIDGIRFEDHPEWFTVDNVTRLATVEDGACAARVLFDLSTEKKRRPDEMDPTALTAGVFQKPGQKLPADVDPTRNLTEDLSFDGYVDLCVVEMTGAYNYSQKCWIFDPSARTFTRTEALDPVISVKIDHQKKKLVSSYRAGGPVYATDEYVWQKGALVQTLQLLGAMGEKVEGGPLPKGFDYHYVRKERRGGRLVKVHEEFKRASP